MGPVGWLDKGSGFFQAPKYDYLTDNRTDCGLILATWREDNGEYRNAYLRRDTGEIAILLEEQGELYPDAEFSEGYAFVRFEMDDYSFVEYLIDQNGSKVVFPSGIYPDGSVNEGVLRISDGNGQCGLARPDGTVIVPPRYEYIEDAGEGRVFFMQDGKLGVMDLEGNVILPASLDYDPGWDYFGGCESHFFHNGYALEKICDENNVRSWVIMDRTGKNIFVYPSEPENDTSFAPCAFVMENRLVWYRVKSKNANKGSTESYGLIRLSDEGWSFLTEPIFDDIPYSDYGDITIHEGFMPVPAETAVTTPSETVATAVLSLDHVAVLSVASLGLTVAVSVSVSPTVRAAEVLFKVTPVTETGVTSNFRQARAYPPFSSFQRKYHP